VRIVGVGAVDEIQGPQVEIHIRGNRASGRFTGDRVGLGRGERLRLLGRVQGLDVQEDKGDQQDQGEFHDRSPELRTSVAGALATGSRALFM